MYYYIHTSGLVKAQCGAEGVWGFHSVGEGNRTSFRRQSVHEDCKRHSTNNFGLSLKCLVNDSPWTPRQGRSELVLLKCTGCIKKDLNVEPVQERNFPLTVLQDALPRSMNQDYTSQQQVWLEKVWPNPATHGPCVIFFIGRTQILYTISSSQMRKLQHKKHLGDFLMGDCRATGSSQLFQTPGAWSACKILFSSYASEWLRQHG